MRKRYTQPLLAEQQIYAQHILSASSEPVMHSATILNEAANNMAGAAPQRLGGLYY